MQTFAKNRSSPPIPVKVAVDCSGFHPKRSVTASRIRDNEFLFGLKILEGGGNSRHSVRYVQFVAETYVIFRNNRQNNFGREIIRRLTAHRIHSVYNPTAHMFNPDTRTVSGFTFSSTKLVLWQIAVPKQHQSAAIYQSIHWHMEIIVLAKKPRCQWLELVRK